MRALPVAGAARTLPVNDENPIIRFAPGRDFTWSRDWNFSIVNEVRINNVGFVSNFDYDEHAATPLLAVIGDSYVEAFMVPSRATCAGRLASQWSGRARVYAFGVSGAPLSQYLAFAEYARDTYRPDALIVVVISNDYDQSLRKYGRKPGMHQFVEQAGGGLMLERADLHRGLVYRWARASALARYLATNLDVTRLPGNLWRRVAGEADRLEREPDARRAVDAYFRMLPAASGLAPERVAFVVDGLRPALYDREQLSRARQGYGGRMRQYFMTHARRRGYHVVDMQPVFAEHYRVHRQRFEWPQDAHWNVLGHRVCHDALGDWDVLADGSLLAGG